MSKELDCDYDRRIIFGSHMWHRYSVAVNLLLPNNDLLQQFEDYVIELRCEKGRRKEKINTIRNKFKNMYKAGSEFKDEVW